MLMFPWIDLVALKERALHSKYGDRQHTERERERERERGRERERRLN